MKRPEFVMGTIAALLLGTVICYGDFSILFGSSEQPQSEATYQPDPRFSTPYDYVENGMLITPIQHVPLGWRMVGKNPELTDADRARLGPEPDQETWRKLVLQMTKSDGHLLDIQLLRSVEWITLSGAEPGATICLNLPEMGAVGDAEILAVEPCPPIEPGEGNIVTGRFAHEAAEAIDLRIEGESKPIGVTANHPFWSVSRQQFIAAGDLYAGELVQTHNGGTRQVISQLPRPGPEPVFNLEIFGEHVYAVADAGILVHNSCEELVVSSVRQAASKLDNQMAAGVKKVNVRVKSRSAAEELFLEKFVGNHAVDDSISGFRGYRNTSDWGMGSVKQHGKAGTYHWDDMIDPSTGRVAGHSVENIHAASKHLQVHTFDGSIVRIFFD